MDMAQAKRTGNCRRRNIKGNSEVPLRNGMRGSISVSLGAACEYAYVKKSSADFQDETAATIADAAIFVEVPQDYYHSAYAQT